MWGGRRQSRRVGQVIHLTASVTFNATSDPSNPEDKPNPEDAQANWNPNTNAAELAYILYRVPVLVAVHASRMLP